MEDKVLEIISKHKIGERFIGITDGKEFAYRLKYIKITECGIYFGTHLDIEFEYPREVKE